jgi:hypothetical protein
MAIIGRTTTDGPESRVLDGALTGEDYMSLVASKDTSVRAAAAARDDVPLGALLAFAQDPKVKVRVAVASNPAIGRAASIAEALAQDKSAAVARALVENSAVHLAAIARIADVGPRAVRALAQGRLLA